VTTSTSDWTGDGSDAFRALDLTGRVALVSGGAQGSGRASSLLLAARGARLAVCDRDGAGAEAVAETIRARGCDAAAYEFDLADENSIAATVAAVVDHFAGLSVLHNNAAYFSPRDQDVIGLDLRAWDRTLAVNARGVWLMCRACLPALIESGNGAIVNTSSVGAAMAESVRPAYAASKAAIGALTRLIATRYGRQGVRCNEVQPGLITSPQLLAAFGDDLRRYERQAPAGLSTPEDIAEAVAFLASDAARRMTGTTVVVDGGATAHLPHVADELDW
jgi:NAD(P)-dependent dehydrogenase (short-subunit alcohol dehydrogenase family)